MSACSPAINRSMRVTAAVKTRAALDNGISLAMLPALAELRQARDGVDVIRLFEDSIPDHLQLQAVAHMIERPQHYKVGVIRTALQLVGFAALVKLAGHNRAASAFERFVAPIEAL